MLVLNQSSGGRALRLRQCETMPATEIQLRDRWNTKDGIQRIAAVIDAAKKRKSWRTILDGFPFVTENYDGPDFRAINLRGVDLREANLSGCNLAKPLPGGIYCASLGRSNLSGADLSGADLSGAKLSGTNLRNANLVGANLSRADLYEADLVRANLSNANLVGTSFTKANLYEANLVGANLTGAGLYQSTLIGTDLSETNLLGANLSEANCFVANLAGANLSGAKLKKAHLAGASLGKANLSQADLSGADLSDANLYEVILTKATLVGANLSRANLGRANLSEADIKEATLVATDLQYADISKAKVYGISAWNVRLEGVIQRDLIITQEKEPVVAVDNLEVAQFIYLLLHNEKIRGVIDTITSKVVLILGRFKPETKVVLDAIRDELRMKGYCPVLFDSTKPKSRDFGETVSTLAHLARFVIADVTDAKIVLDELRHIVPNIAVPVQPILKSGTDREPVTLHDLRRNHKSLLKTHFYDNQQDLLSSIRINIIEPSESMARELGAE